MTGRGVFSNAQEGVPVYLSKNISPQGLTKIYERLMEEPTPGEKTRMQGRLGAQHGQKPKADSGKTELPAAGVVACSRAVVLDLMPGINRCGINAPLGWLPRCFLTRLIHAGGAQ